MPETGTGWACKSSSMSSSSSGGVATGCGTLGVAEPDKAALAVNAVPLANRCKKGSPGTGAQAFAVLVVDAEPALKLEAEGSITNDGAPSWKPPCNTTGGALPRRLNGDVLEMVMFFSVDATVSNVGTGAVAHDAMSASRKEKSCGKDEERLGTRYGGVADSSPARDPSTTSTTSENAEVAEETEVTDVRRGAPPGICPEASVGDNGSGKVRSMPTNLAPAFPATSPPPPL